MVPMTGTCLLYHARMSAGIALNAMQVTDLAVMPDGSIVSASLDRYILPASTSACILG